jgi:hypothetical protein
MKNVLKREFVLKIEFKNVTLYITPVGGIVLY